MARKNVCRGFQPGPTQTGLLATEDGTTLEILDLGGNGTNLYSDKNGADLHVCFHICKKILSHNAAPTRVLNNT